ncbi:MAG: pyridoxal-phosphate dependent enzyme [Opitutaceae bacterium]
MTLDLAAIRDAHERIRPHVTRTPVLPGGPLDAACGGRLFFKCDNLQQGGAFKARGAANAVFALSEADAARGVAPHSTRNHAAALPPAAPPARRPMRRGCAKRRWRIWPALQRPRRASGACWNGVSPAGPAPPRRK